ncbi:MAG: hypothetical protein L0H83_07065 [Salinisphaera sp.]|nr:hypothetical protein [Salinisphaera sp.]
MGGPAQRGGRVRAAALVWMILYTGAASALAPAWTPRLDPPAAGAYRRPDEVFVIRLSAPFDPAAGRLALELDNIDVTDRVTAANDSYTLFTFQPYTRLARGPHVLRMVQYGADGSIVERGRWVVHVRVVDTKVSPALNVGLSQRLDEKPRSDEPTRFGAQGSSRIEAYTDNGNRRWSATGEFLGDSNTITGEGRRPVDLGSFLIQRDAEHSNLTAGQHFPGAIQGVAQGNLIFDGYSRRGISATLRAGPWQGAVTTFILRTESIRGFEHGFGVGDDEHRISGGMARIQPLDNVALAVGYVSGEGAAPGFGTVAADAGMEGDAVNVVIDTNWFDRRLGLRAEAAHSRLELGAGYGEVSDQAYAFGMSFAPLEGLRLGDKLLRWDINLGYVNLGAAFRSIANLGQIANIEEYRAGFNGYLDTVSLNLTAARTEDNVDSALYPSTRAETVNAVLGWQPAVAPDAGGWLFAQPYFSLTVLGDWRKTVRSPEGAFAFPVDLTTRGYVANASFAHPYGRWAVSGGSTSVEDDTDFSADMRYDTAALDVSFQFGPRYSLAPGISYDVSSDLSNDVNVRTTSLRLSQYWAIIAETLDLQIGASLNHSEASNDTQDNEQLTGNLRLSWYLGAFTLWFAGNYFDAESRSQQTFGGTTFVFDQEAETYQVLLGVSLNLGGWSFP